MKREETPIFTYKGITKMSVFCLLLLGYACCGSCGCGNANARSGNGCGSWNGCNGCGSRDRCNGCNSFWSGNASDYSAASGCSCGCTGFGSRSGVCFDTAYYNRQYALCRCCNCCCNN